MTAATQQINESSDIKACLSDLTKIPEKEFEKQFRSWMERDEVARALQAKLRCDLITNFNRTTLGRRLIAETTTSRLTLSPMVLALNTLVAEFLYAQDCHFTLSVFCTEIPFRNTLPDFENVRHFRFKDSEISEILKAIYGTSVIDWNIYNSVSKNYVENTSTSLLFFVIKSLLEKTAETMQQKVTVGTNTRSLPDGQQSTPLRNAMEQSNRDAKSEIYNTNFRYLNKYLIILSKKVKEMSEQFESLQKHKQCGDARHPRVRILKSNKRRKYEDLNRSLERVTENLKQMAKSKRKSRHIGIIVNAIETLATQFQKCATNFENVSKDLRMTPQTSGIQRAKSTSGESLQPAEKPITAPTSAASQTDVGEKTYADWVHEMRYTRNGQRFLDRVEKSLRKAMEKQKRELLVENEVRMRHQRELLKIRYKQKLLEHMYGQGSEDVENGGNRDINESISEQFRQFEIKHFDLLNKIYESEGENKSLPRKVQQAANSSEGSVPANLMNNRQEEDANKSGIEVESLDLRITPSTVCTEQPNLNRQVLLSKSSLNLQQQFRQAVDEIVEEERNVDQIVFDAKLRIKELEQESNQLTEHFLGYLERQRQQKLDARDAAQNLWKDYIFEREKMKKRYIGSSDVETENSNINSSENKEADHRENHTKNNNNEKNAIIGNSNSPNSQSSNSASNSSFKNPIIKAKEAFFERDRKFKAEAERILSTLSNDATPLHPDYQKRTSNNDKKKPMELSVHEPVTLPFTKNPQGLLNNTLMVQLLSDSMSGTDFSSLWNSTSQAKVTTIVLTPTTTPTTTKTTTATKTICYGEKTGTTFTFDEQDIKKAQRHEMFSTATATATAAATSMLSVDRKNQTSMSTTTRTATEAVTETPMTGAITNALPATTLNKSNDNVERRNFGASFEETLEVKNTHNDYKNKTDYGQKSLQHSESNNNKNNNKNYSNKNNSNKSKGLLEHTEKAGMAGSTLKNETSTRKTVLQESMARIQQLFTPHQEEEEEEEEEEKQRNQNHHQHEQHQQQQHQKILLDDVTEEDEEECNEVIEMEKEQQSKQKTIIDEGNKSNNQATKVSTVGNGSENVFSHYKNNLQLKQIPKTTAITATTSPKHQHTIEYTGDDGGNVDGNDITITANIRKQNLAIAPSNNGYKAIEAMPDWQQIGYAATTNLKVASRIERAEYVKNTNELEEVAIEKMSINSNAVEPGRMTRDCSVTVGMSTFTEQEIGELIESSTTAMGNEFTTLSSQSSSPSSFDLQLSVGAGGREIGKDLRNQNTAQEIGSDSNSDFWA